MAYTDQTGDGLSTLVDSSSSYLVRTLQIVRKDGVNYYLMNRDHTPTISTYDANGTETGLVAKLKGETDISMDRDAHWNATTTGTSAADRRDSQQPETDGHFYAKEAWNYYHALGWDGFDNAAYGTNTPVRVAAHIGMDMNAYFDKYYEPIPGGTLNKYYGYIAFYDGQCDGTRVVFDFMAGDPLIFAHEYQHALTFFGAAKSTGEPGHLYGNDWLGGIREGYSDSFACLRNGRWLNPCFWPDGALNSGADFTYGSSTLHTQPFRRVEFPRSTDTVDGTWYCDHYDDRKRPTSPRNRSR
jgi:Zn-dependent metalloprotease